MSIKMAGDIYVSGCDVAIQQNPIDFMYRIVIRDEAALDSIIEQCRDIKLKLMEEQKNDQD